VESGGARPDVVDDLIAAVQGVDLWGFSEVQDEIWATLFEHAAEDGESADFQRILGTTGGGEWRESGQGWSSGNGSWAYS
jgi:hypothetical protein